MGRSIGVAHDPSGPLLEEWGATSPSSAWGGNYSVV